MPRRKPAPRYSRLTAIRLRNFRCYRDTGDIPIRPLTIIVGPNNVGKSSIVNSILLLKQSVQVDTPRETLITSGPLVDLGGFGDILFRGVSRTEHTFSLEFKVEYSGAGVFGSARDSAMARQRVKGVVGLAETFGYSKTANQILAKSITYSRGGESELKFSATGRSGQVAVEGKDGQVRGDMEVHLFGSLPLVHRSRKLSKKLDEAAEKELQELEDRVFPNTWGWIDFFRTIDYIAPLRAGIPRYAILGETSPGSSSANPRTLLQELRSRIRFGPDKETLMEMLNRWASKELGVLTGLDLRPVGNSGTVFALLGNERKGFRGINIASMGEGVSQVLPMLGSLLGSARGGCTLVEQPELHLHPDLQAKLADAFIWQVRNRDRQVILETHSEHILSRVRRRVAEGWDPGNVAVIYVSRPGKESIIRPLPILEDGSMPDWPDGFFEEGLTDAFRIATAKRAGT